MTSLKRILVPVDFSASSRGALAHALELKAALGTYLGVLHVHEPARFVGLESLVLMPIDGQGSRWEQVRGELLHELEHFLGGDRSSFDEVRVEAGVPTDVITEVARRGEFDLVLLGTHGQGPASRLALGTVAEGVMRKAHCRVLTLRVPSRGGAGHEAICL